MLNKLSNGLIVGLFIISLTKVFALNNSLVEEIIKPSINKYFKNQNINFLYIKKMNNGNFFVIIKHTNIQDNITIDKTGKILSIAEDLNALDDTEEGC